jgi:hypothetical protein
MDTSISEKHDYRFDAHEMEADRSSETWVCTLHYTTLLLKTTIENKSERAAGRRSATETATVFRIPMHEAIRIIRTHTSVPVMRIIASGLGRPAKGLKMWVTETTSLSDRCSRQLV